MLVFASQTGDGIMFRHAVAAAAVGGGLILSGPVAQACSECLVSALKQAQPAPRTVPKRTARPVHKPVATAAGRIVKTERGNYANALPSRPVKRRPARVEYLPVVVSTEAAHAFAMTQAFAPLSANVRTVPPDQVNEIDLAANDAPIKPVLVPTRVETAFAVVNAKDFNEIDGQTSAPPSAACDGTAASASKENSWLARMRTLAGHAYAAVSASLSR